MYKKRILIDLDGVLNDYGTEPFDENHIPKIKEGAREFVEVLSKTAELYLFTTRNAKLSGKWLTENNLDEYFKDITNIKIPAFLHIDDRCVCFNGNYKDTLTEINNFSVYWKNKKKKGIK